MIDRSAGVCPVCAGTMRRPCPDDEMRKYGQLNGWFGYDESDDTVDCDNCGKQYQFRPATGRVPLRADGTPCKHEYKGQPGRWHCCTDYVCSHCGDKHMIDSGD